jgi:hypothetical protein
VRFTKRDRWLLLLLLLLGPCVGLSIWLGLGRGPVKTEKKPAGTIKQRISGGAVARNTSGRSEPGRKAPPGKAAPTTAPQSGSVLETGGSPTSNPVAGGSPESVEHRNLAGEEAPLASPDDYSARMNEVLKKIESERIKAKEEGDHLRESCLWAKWELVSGLVRASEWTKKAWKESSGNTDPAVSRPYLKRMKSYASTADEVEWSIPECLRGGPGAETTAGAVGPTDEAIVKNFDEGVILDSGFVPGGERYPVVPPASPYH